MMRLSQSSGASTVKHSRFFAWMNRSYLQQNVVSGKLWFYAGRINARVKGLDYIYTNYYKWCVRFYFVFLKFSRNLLTFSFTALNLNKLLPHPFYVLTIPGRFSNSETAYNTLTWVKLVSTLVWQRTHLVLLQELQILFRVCRVTADDRDVGEYRRHECYERAEPEHGRRYEERFHARFQTENKKRISKLCRTTFYIDEFFQM